MRLLSAIIISGLILAPNAAWSAPSDSAPQHPQDRNPIEWLFSDIGELFATAIEKLDQKAETLDAPSKNDTKVADPDIATAPLNTRPVVNLDDDLFDEDSFDVGLNQDIGALESENTDQPKPTIGELFQNILAALSQSQQSVPSEDVPGTEEIADGETFDFLDTPSAPEIAQRNAPTSSNQTHDLFETLQAAAVAYEEDDAQSVSAEPRPSLGEFFTSIVSAFSGLNTDSDEQEIATLDKTDPVDVAEVDLKETSATEQQRHIDAPVIENTAIPETVAEGEQFELAPWQVSPHVAVFSPGSDIFDESKASVQPIQTPISNTVEVAESAHDVAPVIRKRAEKNPIARNHLSLGRSKASDVAEEETSFLNHLVETFIDDDTKSADQSEVLASRIPDRLIPEEKLDLGYTAPDAKSDNTPTDEVTTIGEGVLKNIDLYLGTNTVIGHSYQPNAHASGACIERSLQVSVFCVTDIDWPSEIAQSFAQDTAFTLPGEGVIRYENGRVSRVYTPFKAHDFAEVVKFMQRRFGPPLEREIVWMHMIEAPKMPNTTFRWRAVSADRKNSVVLEVRNFDDLRRSFADLNRGMVRLYRDGSRPIFKHLSTMDLMLIQRRRITQAPVVPDAETSAN